MINKNQLYIFSLALISHLFIFISHAISYENSDQKSREFTVNLVY